MAEYVPRPQLRHETDDDAPTDVEYVPATQFVHADDPAEAVKDPAPQFRHTLEAVAPAVVEYVPTGQLVHVVALEAAQAPALHVTDAAGTAIKNNRTVAISPIVACEATQRAMESCARGR